MIGGFRRLYAVFWVYLKECFAYPVASAIWVLGDVQTALILPAVWIAAAGPGGKVAGMTQPELVAYYLVTMTIAQFVICHLLWDIAWDIREGAFSSQIVRPIPFFPMNAARNLSWRVAKLILFTPLLGLIVFAYGGVRTTSLQFTAEFWAALILAHTLSFIAAYAVSMITFWTTEFMSVFRLYYFPEMFLSGRLLPLDALPPWVKTVSEFTHFPYMVAFPANVLLGRVPSDQIGRGLVMQVVWCVVFYGLGRVLFARGTRQYTGVGM